ncbi:MAG: DNA repair protein RadC [Verrucomicrobiota bacterium]|jgi:DNA repair protein RadC|nr:DNA repair protein RadC [Verrucomicrobiota bacterium]
MKAEPPAEPPSAPLRYEISLSRIKDLPDHRRPRELALESGIENMPDEALIAILLRAGIRGQSVIDLSRRILDLYQGSLEHLSAASHDELKAIKGIGSVKALELCAALELGHRAAANTAKRSFPLIRNPIAVLNLLKTQTQQLDQEVFWVLLLDQKYRLKRSPISVTKGILNASLVHPREVFREAIRSAAAAILIAHNHPSGDPVPSVEDINITRQLVEAGNIVGIELLDHIVIGGKQPHPAPYISLRERGLGGLKSAG